MDDAERLHPLVAMSAGQVASVEVQLEYWESLAAPWRADGQLPEELAQRLQKLHEQLEHDRAVYRRLKEKLDAAEYRRALELGEASIDGSRY